MPKESGLGGLTSFENVDFFRAVTKAGVSSNVSGEIIKAFIGASTITKINDYYYFQDASNPVENDYRIYSNGILLEFQRYNSGTWTARFKMGYHGAGEEVTTINTASHTLVDTDYCLNVQYSLTGAASIVIPTTQKIDGRIFKVKDSGGNASTYNITISTEGSEKIDGSDTFTIDVNYGSIMIYSDGTNWFIRY